MIFNESRDMKRVVKHMLSRNKQYARYQIAKIDTVDVPRQKQRFNTNKKKPTTINRES